MIKNTRLKGIKIIRRLTAVIILLSVGAAYSQKNIVLRGVIYNSETKKPVDFGAVVIPELRIKVRTDLYGRYSLSVPQKGIYTIYVSSSGLETAKAKMELSGSTVKDFYLKPIRIKSTVLIVKGERDLQKVSRRTLTAKEMKEVPASFGDSINALTSLPGIDRTDGFFGPLVIRGVNAHRNRYYADGMPIIEPMHFGGIHSVIANEMMSEIDLYASSFPACYGGATAAVIEINTLDTVKEPGGIVDIGLISAMALVKSPLTKTVASGNDLKEESAGYIIASGRVGYLTLLIPYFYELFTDEKLTWLPEYYDFQFKSKYYFNKSNSLTFLAIGSKDYWKLVLDDAADIDPEAGDDPLMQDFDLKIDSSFVNTGLYYTYNTGKLKNTIMAYTAFMQVDSTFDAGPNAAKWAQDYYMNSNPYIYGIKDSFKLEWINDTAQLRGAVEFTYYDFKADGISLSILENQKDIDIADNSAVNAEKFNLKSSNKTVGGFIDSKFTFGGLKFVPGVRYDYLDRSKKATVDPRGLISYETESALTVSAASGLYSSFFQTNPFFFAYNPDFSVYGKKLEPEKAVHNVLGIEQEIDLFTLGIELFYNYSYNLAVAYGHIDDKGEFVAGQNSGKTRAYGIELMLRKDRKEGTNDFFGWLSYTYTQSKYRSGITGNVFTYDESSKTYIQTAEKFDPNGSRWIRGDFEREHSLKLVMGYRYNSHTFSCRFQLYSSFPYTPIVGNYPPITLPTGDRYQPLYSDNVNSEHYPVDHRLDLRYSYQANYKWGHIKWYIEIINIYGLVYKPKDTQKWKYNEPYSADNPEITREEGGLSIIPNFGVEIKF